jgi:hypothetical protein
VTPVHGIEQPVGREDAGVLDAGVVPALGFSPDGRRLVGVRVDVRFADVSGKPAVPHRRIAKHRSDQQVVR